MNRPEDPRVKAIRDAVLRHLEQDDQLGVSWIVDSIADVIESQQGITLAQWERCADAVAMLASALPESGIEQVHAEATKQGGILEAILIENAAEDAALAGIQ